LNNQIQTWAQGRFVEQPHESNFTDAQKAQANELERFLVRPDPLDTAICRAYSPQDAEWIASRLNLASKLEQLTYDFAMGKTDGEEIRSFVRASLD